MIQINNKVFMLCPSSNNSDVFTLIDENGKVAKDDIYTLEIYKNGKEIEYDSTKHEEYAETLLSAPFEIVFGSVIQKLNNIKNLDASFKGLFNSDQKKEEDDGRDVSNQFMKYFGWIYQAKLVADHEGIELDKVYKMSTISFLNDLSYLISKGSYEAELRRKANGNR
jgi:hypothetical protein